ncbi:MAG: hypothetical protein O9972_15270 [Burkholderiales bacterium]|nr:hypothetical protein [Burkholderiales bacterium]
MRLIVAAFAYPARFQPFWHDSTAGFGSRPAKAGLIDVPASRGRA